MPFAAWCATMAAAGPPSGPGRSPADTRRPDLGAGAGADGGTGADSVDFNEKSSIFRHFRPKREPLQPVEQRRRAGGGGFRPFCVTFDRLRGTAAIGGLHGALRRNHRQRCMGS